MPERQQTQGDFGSRPVRPQQQITDTYSAPRLPKPDLSVLKGIGQLSDTAFKVMDFQQKQEEFQKKAGKELGETNPDFQIGAGTTEAALAGFQEGRGTALRTRFESQVESNWKIATEMNDGLLNDNSSYTAFHDAALNQFVADNNLEGIALNKFLVGADEYRASKTSDHIVASLGYQKKLFLKDAEDLVLSSFTHMENEKQAIEDMSLFDLVTATDELVDENGNISMPTSVATLTPEDITERKLKLQRKVSMSRVSNIQDMLDHAHTAGPQTLQDVETYLINGFISELKDGNNPNMAYMVMRQLTTGPGRFMDRPAVVKALRENAEDIEKNTNGLHASLKQGSIMQHWINSGANVSEQELADALGETVTQSRFVLEDYLSNQSFDQTDAGPLFSPNKFATNIAALQGVQKLPKLGARVQALIGQAVEGTFNKQDWNTTMVTFSELNARVGADRTKALLDLDDKQYQKLNFIDMFLSETDEEGQPINTIEDLFFHPNLKAGNFVVKDLPDQDDLRNALVHAGDSIWFREGFAPLQSLIDDDADVSKINNELLSFANNVYQYVAMKQGNEHLNEKQLLSETVTMMNTLGYDVGENGRVIRTTPNLSLDDIEEVELQAKRQIVNMIRTQKREFRTILNKIRKEEPFRKGVVAQVFGMYMDTFTPDFITDTTEEKLWKKATAMKAKEMWEQESGQKLYAESEMFADFDYDEWLNFDDDEDDIDIALESDHTLSAPKYRFVDTNTNNVPQWAGDKLKKTYSDLELDVMLKERQERKKAMFRERWEKTSTFDQFNFIFRHFFKATSDDFLIPSGLGAKE